MNILSSDRKFRLEKAYNEVNAKEQLFSNITNDLLIQTHSGMGKTKRMVVVALNRIDSNVNQTQCLVFCATFDTAIQTLHEITELCDAAKLNVKTSLVSIYEILAQNGDHILIGTPNEIMEMAVSLKSIDTIHG